MTNRFVSICILVALAFQTSLSAQSLAEVAKAEEARRKSVKGAGKVYTNDDLGGGAAAPPAPSQPAVSTSTAKPADAAAKPEENKAVDPTKTEKYWKDRAQTIQQSLSRNKLLLDALQSQSRGLNAEFMNTDDPGQRELIRARIERVTGELQRVQQDIEQQTKASTDLLEEARKAGVPAGWLR
jgi:hypothetical protein